VNFIFALLAIVVFSWALACIFLFNDQGKDDEK
jgi:hypothetical protein